MLIGKRGIKMDKVFDGMWEDFIRDGFDQPDSAKESIRVISKEYHKRMLKADNIAKKLAQECIDVLQPECTCDKAYTSRGMIDRSCQWHEIGQYLLPIANEILSRVEGIIRSDRIRKKIKYLIEEENNILEEIRGGKSHMRAIEADMDEAASDLDLLESLICIDKDEDIEEIPEFKGTREVLNGLGI